MKNKMAANTIPLVYLTAGARISYSIPLFLFCLSRLEPPIF